jgi:hypothetical protein
MKVYIGQIGISAFSAELDQCVAESSHLFI